MEKVFIDSDIILDWLAERKPYYAPAAALFSLAERGALESYVSPLIFANLFYILRKLKSPKEARTILKKLRLVVKVLPIDEKIIDQALASEFTDFEDAIQYHTALQHSVTALITRNTKDYKKPAISVCTAEEYLAMREATE